MYFMKKVYLIILTAALYSSSAFAQHTLNVINDSSHIWGDASTFGIKDVNSRTDLMIYPNPVQNKIFFANIEIYSIRTVQIFDLLGKKHFELLLNKTNRSYNVSDLRKGMYILRFLDNKGTPILTRSFHKN